MTLVRPILLSGLALVMATSTCQAADPPDVLAKKMKKAIDRGTKYLISKQQPDGSWKYPNQPMKLQAYPMPQGVTALCAFALLKCGIPPEHEAIKKAFAFLHQQELRETYSVGCLLLAIEAKVHFDPGSFRIIPPGADPMSDGETYTRKDKPKKKKRKRRRPDPRDLQLAKRCVDFLGKSQRKGGLWRYYLTGTDEDASNAQYACLGLDAAERMRIPVPKHIYEKCAARLVAMQDKGKGEKMKPFPVPGADSSYRSLKKIDKELKKTIRKVKKKFRKKKFDKGGKTKEDRMRTASRKAAKKVIESMKEQGDMEVRGWPYFPPETSGQGWQKKVNGSMTCSALAALFICKARLEGTSRYERELRPKINKSLRDGAAWMAKNYDIRKNPGGNIHHYYYLYGLERAGILGLIHRFGTHDWFSDGVHLLLSQQKGGGEFHARGQGTSGPVPDTCFALLFLARGTTPPVTIPGRMITGARR